MDMTLMMWGVLFSSIGLGYFMYGKKITNPWFRITGMALMLYPVVVSNVWVMLGLGVALVAAPHVIRW